MASCGTKDRMWRSWSVKSFVAAIEFIVTRAIGVEEVLVGRFGVPEVEGEIEAKAGGIPEELSTPEMGVALKEQDPGTLWPIGSLKAFLTSWLDFELPEDYKHRCPIFCSRQATIQDNFKGEDWCAGRM